MLTPLTPLPAVCPPEIICHNLSPADALAVINYINAFGPGPVPPAPKSLDYNGDDWVTAADVLLIINQINAGQEGQGEYSVVQPIVQQSEPSALNTNDTLDALALDDWLTLEGNTAGPNPNAV
jgi:hypothetical protein